MYKVTEIAPRLGSLLIPVIPELVASNAASRHELIDAVSEMTKEVQEGLGLVATFVRRASYLETKDEMGKHFFQAEKELGNIDRKTKLIGDAAPKILQSF
jgi:hypothetical protein